MRPLFLGDDEADVPAAIHLAARHQVGIVCDPTSAAGRALADAGFTPVVDGLHCLHDTMLSLADLRRHRRRSLTPSLGAWEQAGLHLLLTSVDGYGEDRWVENFYHRVLVRHLYTEGRSPHGAHSLPRFRALLRGPTVLAVVTRVGSCVGGAVLHEADLRALRGNAPPHAHRARSLVGKVYGLDPAVREAARAFKFLLCRAVGHAGWPVLSMGVDTGWVDAGYVPVLLDKLRWADWVGVACGRHALHLAIDAPKAPHRDQLAGLLIGRHDLAQPLAVNLPADQVDAVARALRRHVGGGTLQLRECAA
ncbi:MAG TPA: hypothetical protein VFW21_01775 [Mycobacterium sp.]|nr:hypothetical protein [Mycobacterium sp.]